MVGYAILFAALLFLQLSEKGYFVAGAFGSERTHFVAAGVEFFDIDAAVVAASQYVAAEDVCDECILC